MAIRILIIEDEVTMAGLIKKRLESHGYEAETAFDGESGLKKARENCPDLILLDIMLPKIDGYKVCRLLKFDDKYKSIPIILLTALGQESDVATGKDVGADGYLLKPFDGEKLLAKIEELLKK
ncbi:MAG: response regulator [Chlamydiae bacterium]|nr:response regulator [Chlamydiota bacterium]MBI3277147.1 response regulator [Chlamydiota bacterium]